MNITKLVTMATALLMFGCGDAPDLGNPDNFPLEVTRTIDDNGVEHVETKQLPFDYDVYGQAQQALTVAPPRFYGITSVGTGLGSDTRCPEGGFTSGTSYCEMPGIKHINWDFSGVDGRIDSQMKISVRTYAIQGFASAAQDASPSGFAQEKDNPAKGIDGRVFFETDSCAIPGSSAHGYMCETSNIGAVTLFGGQRVRLDSQNHAIRINPDKILEKKNGTAAQQAFTVMNFLAHEVGHSEGFGHVPSSLRVEVMNLETGNTNQTVLHLSSEEKTQLTQWIHDQF